MPRCLVTSYSLRYCNHTYPPPIKATSATKAITPAIHGPLSGSTSGGGVAVGRGVEVGLGISDVAVMVIVGVRVGMMSVAVAVLDGLIVIARVGCGVNVGRVGVGVLEGPGSGNFTSTPC